MNPVQGIAFDVPPEWELKSTDWVRYVARNGDPEDKPLIAMRAPAYLDERWCRSDNDRDGSLEDTPLATVGTKTNTAADSPRQVASLDPQTWVFGQYAQPDRRKIRSGPVEDFTTRSGLTGSLGSAWSDGAGSAKKCTSDGKAWTFAFRDPRGDVESVSFVGATNVPDEVADTTLRKIMGTVRRYQGPSYRTATP
ncbi:hypothetical protein ACFWII_08580 [Streptomyces sp. NPDC127063]|uniref:hypothetical protein n=1 Tax=Streptomyces sp. NPDC127063 TaxID=3347123 RepID=UPI003658A453